MEGAITVKVENSDLVRIAEEQIRGAQTSRDPSMGSSEVGFIELRSLAEVNVSVRRSHCLLGELPRVITWCVPACTWPVVPRSQHVLRI